MLTEPQQQFLDNLLSGEFVQGAGALRRNDDTWCCLGVACETYRRVTGEGEWDTKNKSSWTSYEFILAGRYEDSVMPWEVARWLGLGSQNPYLERNTAAEYNDGTAIDDRGDTVKWDFAKIAEGFKKLFERRNDDDE